MGKGESHFVSFVEGGVRRPVGFDLVPLMLRAIFADIGVRVLAASETICTIKPLTGQEESRILYGWVWALSHEATMG